MRSRKKSKECEQKIEADLGNMAIIDSYNMLNIIKKSSILDVVNFLEYRISKPFIGRFEKSQIFKSYAYSHFLKQMFLSQGNAKTEKCQGG